MADAPDNTNIDEAGKRDTTPSALAGLWQFKKQIIAAALFALVALWMSTVVPSVEIAWVTAILLLTIYLFAFEIVGVDVAAATVMVLLGLTSLLAPSWA
jgi:hypothetical protein